MSAARCPLCRARMLAPTQRTLCYGDGARRGFALACASCGLLLDAAPDETTAAAIAAALSGRAYAGSPDDAFGMDAYTLRCAASAFSKRTRFEDAAMARALREPHSPLAARARLEPLGGDGVPVSLGLLCRPEEIAAVLAGLCDHRPWTHDVAILVGGPASPERPVPVEGFADGAVRMAGRPLDGDFAAQRNALQAMARTGWMLQLDADETLGLETARMLPAFARLAQEDGVVSIGLPRRNLVDGALSDVFPDVQYRLNRREIAYEGRVHERPERDWRQSLLVLHGAIDHHLSRAHVEARSARYEAMDPGRGRLEERSALLVPYRD